MVLAPHAKGGWSHDSDLFLVGLVNNSAIMQQLQGLVYLGFDIWNIRGKPVRSEMNGFSVRSRRA